MRLHIDNPKIKTNIMECEEIGARDELKYIVETYLRESCDVGDSSPTYHSPSESGTIDFDKVTTLSQEVSQIIADQMNLEDLSVVDVDTSSDGKCYINVIVKDTI